MNDLTDVTLAQYYTAWELLRAAETLLASPGQARPVVAGTPTGLSYACVYDEYMVLLRLAVAQMRQAWKDESV
jgi:hypothetical protein